MISPSLVVALSLYKVFVQNLCCLIRCLTWSDTHSMHWSCVFEQRLHSFPVSKQHERVLDVDQAVSQIDKHV